MSGNRNRSSAAVSIAVLLLNLLSILPLTAQPSPKKVHTLKGKVEQVNPASKRVTVSNEPVEGWMGAMTMQYAVDQEALLTSLKPGDRIVAKVYEGDMTLREVQAAAELSLESLEQMALKNNPTVAQVQANGRAAAGTTRQAGLYPNPTIGYYGDEIRGGYINGGKQGGFVSQTIVTGGKLGAARRVAQLRAAEIGTSAEIQRLRILNNVRILFYQVLAAQRLVEVRQDLAKLTEDAAATSHQLGNIGQADRPDILQSEVEQQQASVSLRVAQQNLEATWRMLAAVVGTPGFPVARLEGDLDAIPELNYRESVAVALRDSPEIKLAQQAVERAAASLAQARKMPIPDLQITGTLVQSYEPLDNPRRITGVQGGAQIGVQVPVFNRNQGNVEAAKAAIESAQQEQARLKLQLERDLAGLFQEYDSARITARQYKSEMLPRAEQAYKLYEANYQNMAAAYPQVLISQRTLFQLRADYIAALASAWRSSLEIRGFGLTDGLSTPMP